MSENNTKTRTATANLKGICLAICTPTEGPEPLFSRCLLQTTQYLNSVGMQWRYIPEEGDSHVMRARNVLIAKALRNPMVTHVLQIDSDLGWEPSLVTDLLSGMVLGNHDVACVVYPKKCEPISWPCNFVDNGGLIQQDERSGFLELSDAPTGFLCVTRQAFIRLMNAHPDRKCSFGPIQPAEELAWSYDLFPSFIDPTSADRRYLSEDFGFCRLWQNIGGRIWAHAAGELTHVGKKEYKGKLADSMRRSSPVVERAAKIEGWMSIAELNWLSETAAQMDGAIEVGSWKGRSSVAIAASLKSGNLACFDTWEGQPDDPAHKEAHENLESVLKQFRVNTDGLPILEMRLSSDWPGGPRNYARRFFAGLDGNGDGFKVDMVFIDGDHRYEECLADIRFYSRFARRLICGHDYTDPKHLGVKRAVDEAFGDLVRIVPGTSIWFVTLTGVGSHLSEDLKCESATT